MQLPYPYDMQISTHSTDLTTFLHPSPYNHTFAFTAIQTTTSI